MANHSKNKRLPINEQEEALNAALKKFGFLFPTNEKEIEQFEEVFGSTEIEVPSHLSGGKFLSKYEEKTEGQNDLTPHSSSAKIVPITKARPFDYYKRTLLAAEIVNELHTEMTLGHLKLQKLIYLAQRTEQMNLPVNFLKQAMGPYDPQMMRSIDKQLVIKKWFQFLPGEKLKYKPLEKAGSHKSDFEKYFGNEKQKIQWLVDTFKKVKSDRVEIIATLFGCWEELLKDRKAITEDNLLINFFAWSKLKEKFKPESVVTEIAWMKDNELHP